MAHATAAPARIAPELMEYLRGPRLVLVTTLDADTKWPTNNLITWVLAVNETTLRLAADATGRILGNIAADERVLLTVIAHGACHTIEGTGRVLEGNVEGVSLKLGVAEVKVRAVRDVTFWGGTITAEPQYDVTYDRSTKEKLDTGVFADMRRRPQ